MSEFANMNDEQFLNTIQKAVGERNLQRMTVDLPALMIARFPERAALFTADFLTRYALALYMVVIGMPPHLMAMLEMVAELSEKLGEKAAGAPPTLFDLAFDYLEQMPDRCEPAFLRSRIVESLGAVTPLLAGAITEPVIADAARMCLMDWIESDPLDFSALNHDTHFYLDTAMLVHGTKPSDEALRAEADTVLDNPPADVPPEIIERARRNRNAWRDSHA